MLANRLSLALLFAAPAVLFGGGQMSTTVLTSTPNPSAVGQTVTVTATVTAAPYTPTGTVEIFDGSVDLGPSTSLGNGVGTFSTATLARGVHALTGHYSGDSNALPGTSAIYSQSVGPTTTTLTSATSTVIFGQPLTLTATVSPASATGKITFYDGATVLGTGTIGGSSGAASIPAILSSGARSLKAYYLGDSNNAPSTSAVLAETVNAVAGTGFTQASPLGTGVGPTGIAEGDFNGDGIVDFAVTNQSDNTVTIFLSDAVNGGYHPGVVDNVGNSPTAVAVGDLNGDGNLDLIVANNGDSTISVLLGSSSGTFTAETNSPYTVTSYPSWIAVGDFNGDGVADLAVVDSNDNNLSVLLGVGDGTFLIPTTMSAGDPGDFSFSVVTADFNGDGFADLAVSNYLNSCVSVLLGNGDGTFQSAIPYDTGGGPGALIVGDFNGDTFPDIAAANGFDGSVSVLLNSGTGTFPNNVAYAVTNPPDALATGDFNGDGNLDLVVGTGGSVEVLLGNSNGTLQPSRTYGTDSSSGLVVGDFNGDGVADIASTDGATNDTLQIFLGTPGPGTFMTSSVNPSTLGQNVTFTATVTPSSATGTVAFMDGMTVLTSAAAMTNGVATYMTSALSSGLHSITAVYSGDGSNPTSTSPAVTQLVNLPATTTTLISSVNPSTYGASVMLTASVSPSTATGSITFMDGNSTIAIVPLTTGSAATSLTTLTVGSHSLTAVYAGDSTDAASTSTAVMQTVNQANTTTALISSANPSTFNQPVTLTATVSPSTATGTVAFATSSTTYCAASSLSSGVATCALPQNLTLGSYVVTATYSGDSNDGTSASTSLDQTVNAAAGVMLTSSASPSVFGQSVTLIAAISPPTATGKVTFYNGASILGTSMVTSGQAVLHTISIPAGAASLKAYYLGDANNGNGTSTALSQIVNAKVGTGFTQGTSLHPGSSPYGMTEGDFNGDGIVDFAVANQSANTVTILLSGATGGGYHAGVAYNVGANPISLSVGDFNGDGNLDIVVSNQSGGTLSVLLGSSSGVFTAASPATVGPHPTFVTVADFNGDGLADLAVTDAADNSVRVLLGVGDGTFHTAVAYTAGGAGGASNASAAADFNGDGFADLAVVDQNNNIVSILMGKGDGTFQAPVGYATGASPGFVLVGDFNGDTFPDLAVVNSSDHTTSVLLNSGTGTFSPIGSYALDSYPQSFASGDFNGDGHLDLAVTTNGGVDVLLGSSSGAMQPEVTYGTNTSLGMVVGDFNGDGIADIAATDQTNGNTLEIFLGTPAHGTALISSVNPSSAGQSVTFTATVTPSSATGTVTFMDGTTALTPASTTTSGVATYVTSALSVTSHSITAVYSGDTNNPATTSPAVVQVVNLVSTTTTLTSSTNPSNYGDSVTLTVSVSPSTATGPVAFKDGTGTIAMGTLSGGTAMTSISTLGAGSHSLTVVYGGDTNDTASTSPAVMQEVNQATTTTTLISSANPSTYQHAVNLTAAVSPATATGTVTFAVGATTYCSGVTVSAGAATCPLPQSLSPGGYVIVATYTGDSNYLVSASSALDQTVYPASPVTLTSSVTPSIYGETVALTAAVPTPGATGKVTFYNRTTMLGISPLMNGQAVLNTTLLPAGAASLTAYYAGDANNGSGVSTALPQTAAALAGSGFTLPPVEYTAGTFPTGAVVGDFNRDGFTDVAVANQNSSNVSVFLGTGTGTFGTAVNYTVGALPSMVTTGDFNGDGITDLVTANSNGSSVSVLLGNSDGTFQAALNHSTTGSPNSVAVGDFNGDGKADIAVTVWGSSVVNVLLGNGDGTFQTPVSYPTGGSPKSLAIGDFNGDGFADLALVSSATNSIDLLAGVGDGTFGTATTINAGTNPSLLAVGYFNLDAIADLVVSNDSGISVFLGNGNATFQGAVTYETSSDPQALAVADFNGDGYTDVLLANPFLNNVVVLFGDGGGDFTSHATYTTGAGNGVAVGDFNGDGRADIALADYTHNTMDVLLAIPQKASPTNTLTTSANPTALGASLTLTSTLAPGSATGTVTFMDGSTTLGTGTVTSGVATYATSSLSLSSHSLSAVYGGDLYNVASTSNTITEVVSQDTPATLLTSSLNPSLFGQSVTFTATVQSSTASGSVTFMDGVNTLGTVALTSQSAVFNTSTLAFGSHSITAVYGGDTDDAGSTSTALAQSVGMSTNTTVLTSSLTPSVYGHSVTLTAAVSALATGKVTFYDGPTVLGTGILTGGITTLTTSLLPSGTQSLRALYEGDANFSPLSSAIVTQVVNAVSANGFLPATTSAAGTSPYTTVMADFNGDQVADLVTTNQNQSTVTVILGAGDGTFQAPASFALSNNGLGVAVGDFNDDGKTDIAVTTLDNVVSVLLGNGSGGFSPAVNYAVGTGPQTVTVADFNGDGYADLAVTNNDGTVSILLGRGDGTFLPKASYPAGITPDGIAVGYFDANLSADLVVTNPESDTVSVLLGNGDGTFQTAATYATGSVPADVVVGDFNGDGKADLAVSNLEDDSISILLGAGDGTFGTQVPYATGNGPAFLAVGDFDGDGKQDLAVDNLTDATLEIFHGVGDGTFAQSTTYTVGTSPAGVVAADFNSDGRTDAAVANSTGVTIFLGTLRAATTTTLTSSLNPSSYGQSVTLTATLSPLTATGTVTFMDGSTSLGVVPVVSGIATVVSSTWAVGVHSITAIYSGDNSDLTSSSAAFSQTVDQDGTATTLSSSLNPSIYGQSVTLTATLLPLTASGAITFKDGSTVVGSAPLSGGMAVLLLPSLTIASHSFTAVYGGDVNDLPNTSAIYIQTVNAIPTITTVVPSENPATYGDPVSLTASVSPSTATGSVTFRDGSTVLYTTSLINGAAAVATQDLASGSHAITATYNGDAFDAVSTGSLTLQVDSCGTVTESSLFADSNGGSQPLTITSTDASCNWSASSTSPWIQLSEMAGVGSALVTVTLAQNTTGNFRTGTILIGGQSVAVTQRETAQVFADVPPSVYYFDETNLLYAKQVTSGCSTDPLDYCPNADILRWQMAVFIVRSVYGGDNFTTSAVPYFSDVPVGSPGFLWIQKMYELGITSGCGDGDFCPNQSVPRDQMAIFVIRMRYGSSALFDYPTTPYFTDVISSTFGFEWIQRLREDNITTGCAPALYCPTDLVTRGEMSVFIMLGGFNVMLPPGTPVISTISPGTISQGLSATYTITGLNTNFVQGTTTLAPIPGITIGAITVSSSTVLTVTLTAAGDAVLQPESVLAITGAEEAVLPNSLVIQ